MDTPTIDQLLDQLKQQRDQAATMRENKRKIIDQVQKSEAYTYADECQQRAEEQMLILEADIRSMTLAAHSNGEELPERVSVKKFQTVSYDVAAAREWCFTNFRPALKMDDKAFEKAAKDGNVPADIASVSQEYRAQIATKL